MSTHGTPRSGNFTPARIVMPPMSRQSDSITAPYGKCVRCHDAIDYFRHLDLTARSHKLRSCWYCAVTPNTQPDPLINA
ncbi:MAG: hypothetical protein WBP12_01205 [Candidatus Saccharimonas sp.]